MTIKFGLVQNKTAGWKLCFIHLVENAPMPMVNFAPPPPPQKKSAVQGVSILRPPTYLQC